MLWRSEDCLMTSLIRRENASSFRFSCENVSDLIDFRANLLFFFFVFLDFRFFCFLRPLFHISMTEYIITLFGRGSVGKSAILIQYVKGYFEKEYDPTIEDDYSKAINFKGRTIQLKLYDTAGEEELRSYRAGYIRKSHGFILIYALNDRASLEETEKLFNDISQEKKDPIILLCGNKSDLKEEREITREEGEELAQYMKGEYMETSAKTRENIDELFNKITEMIDKKVNPGEKNTTAKREERRKFCLLL